MEPPAYSTPSQHSLDNPHQPGSPEWSKWERTDMERSGDPVARTVASLVAQHRLAALQRSFDTPQERAAQAVDALVVEAGCEPVRDPWCARWVAEMRTGIWCYGYGFAYCYDPDEDD